MCKPASFWVTRDRAYWSRNSDEHQAIIREHGLTEDVAGRPTGVRVELSPAGADYSLPLAQWTFLVDQDILPEWWDAAEGERLARLELEAWAGAALVRAGEVRGEVTAGERVVAVLGGVVGMVCGGEVLEVCGGEVLEVRGGVVREVLGGEVGVVSGGVVREVRGGVVGMVRGGVVGVVCGGEVRMVCGGEVREVRGGEVREVRGGVVCFSRPGRTRLFGLRAIVVDDTGSRSVCHVGEREARQVVIG
jgi:hypothetical protein